jgi:hypothetical protein
MVLRHHRKGLASAVLGLWLFALLVGITHACGRDGATAAPHMSNAAVHAAGDAIADDLTPGCDDLNSNDLPLPRVLRLVQDPPAGVALLVAAHPNLGLLPNAALPSRVARYAHPPPGVPFSHRSVRLTL